MGIRALLFDVYGTLLDVHGLTATLEQLAPGKGAALSALWRQKQIDYTRLRTMSGKHAPFDQVTAEALEFACDALGARLTAVQRQEMLGAYERLPAHGDAAPAFAGLSGLPLGVLSNGTPQMLETALAGAGLRDRISHVLSIEVVGRYKTAPEAYRIGTDALGLEAGEIGFVSANGWDAAGASWFGYRVFWVNRRVEPMERLGVRPEREGRSLSELAGWVAGG
jgi:2-haloacid dehalogenase